MRRAAWHCHCLKESYITQGGAQTVDRRGSQTLSRSTQ